MTPLLNRRGFLKGGVAGVAGAALLGAAGCGAESASAGSALSLWYWTGSISDTLLGNVQKKVGVKLEPQKIGGDFKSKFMTSLAGRSYVPDITGINSDVATYFPDADQFVDLRKFGADKLKDQYLDWKWQQGVTNDGRMIGFPMDTGPTALYYRTDIFKKAGLPTEPADVEAHLRTWDDYLAAGQKLKSAIAGTCIASATVNDIFDQVMAQSSKQYMDRQNHFIGDQPHVRNAWDISVKVIKSGLTAKTVSLTADWNAVMTNGKVPCFVGAVWMKNFLGPAAPKTKGQWRVCRAPGGAGNSGGSFLGVTKYCKRPEDAYNAIRYLESTKNQAFSYQDINLFPSTPASYQDPIMRKPDPFYGGQVTVDIFGKAAEQVKPFYFSPYDDAITPAYATELGNVESLGKDPDQAWNDCIGEIKRTLQHTGVI